MSANHAAASPTWLTHLGDIRWVRGHISTFCIGAVLIVCANLLIGGSAMWSFTAIGIWIMLLLVHIVMVLIARLSMVLMADDDEEVVLLPIKDALIVDPNPTPDPAQTWTDASSKPGDATLAADETVSWTVATDMAQARRKTNEDTSA